MSKKIWKISDFSGGLNNYTNSFDLESNEFELFQDVSAERKGVLRPLGNNRPAEYFNMNYFDINDTDLSSIINGAGFHVYDANYTFFPSSPDTNLFAEFYQFSSGVEGYLNSFRLKLTTCLWLFKTAIPVKDGSIAIQAKVNGVPIMEAVTMFSGNLFTGVASSGYSNKFIEKTLTTTGLENSEDLIYSTDVPSLHNRGIENPMSLVPYEVSDFSIYGIPGRGSGSGVGKALSVSVPTTSHGELFFAGLSAPSAWPKYVGGQSENSNADTYFGIFQPHNTFNWFSDDYKNATEWHPGVGLEGYGDFTFNDSRLPLGWSGRESETRRWAIGPSLMSGMIGGHYGGTDWRGDISTNYESFDLDMLTWLLDGGANLHPPEQFFPACNRTFFPAIEFNNNTHPADAVAYSKYAKHAYDVMMRSIHREIIKGINSYNGTILTVDNLEPSHTAWQGSQAHTNITGVSNGSGTGLTVNIETGGTGADNTTFTIVTGGYGYAIDEEITFTDPGLTSNTAVLVVATIGGTSPNDSYTAKFKENEFSAFPVSQPHLLNSDVITGSNWETTITPSNPYIPDDGLARNLEIHLTNPDAFATDSDYIDITNGSEAYADYDSGTPAQVSQYSWTDTDVDLAVAMGSTDDYFYVEPEDSVGLFTGDIIKIDDGSNPEIMKITTINRMSDGEVLYPDKVKINVLRGDDNYWGLTSSAKSGATSQFQSHNVSANIYKDSIGLFDPHCFMFEDGEQDEFSIGHDISLMTTIPMTGIRNFYSRNSLFTNDIHAAPCHMMIRLYGYNNNNDGFSFRIIGDGSWVSEVIEVPRNTGSLSDIYNVIKAQVGEVKKNSGETIVAGISGISVGSPGVMNDNALEGGQRLDIYFIPTDTSTTMVTAADATGEAPGINTLTEVAIASGMDNFSVGDCICWKTNSDSVKENLTEVARIYSKSGSGSSGTIKLVRNITDVQIAQGSFGSTTSACQEIKSNNVLTKCVVGIGSNKSFTITDLDIQSGETVESQNFLGDEVFYSFINKTEIRSHTLLPSGNFGKKLNFGLYSQNVNSWVNLVNPFGYDINEEFNWVYGDVVESEKSLPVMFSEDGKLRLSESNFILPNKNKILQFLNISNQFQDPPDASTTYSTYTFPGDVATHGYGMFDNETAWDFTVIDSKIDDPSILGLSISNDATGVNNALSSAYIGNSFGRMYVKIIKNSSTTTGVDWSGKCRFYATAVYDDGSETLPVHKFDTDLDFGDGEENGFTDSLNVEVYLSPTQNGKFTFGSPRVSGIKLYYTNEADNFIAYNTLGTIHFEHGFIKASSIRSVDDSSGINSSYVWKDYTQTNSLYIYNIAADSAVIVYDNMPVEETYNINTLIEPTENRSLNARYKTVTVTGKRAFIGNVLVNDGFRDVHYPDGLLVSPIGSLDVFPFPQNLLQLDVSDGSNITALASIGDKVLQFKENILYIVNISSNIEATFFIEERHKYKGVLDKNHVCETAEGVFWFNKKGAFLYDGETIKDLMVKKGDDDEENERRIHPKVWSNFINKNSLCGYNPSSEQLFVVKSSIHTANKESGDAYIYNVDSDSWSLGKHKFWSGTGTDLTFTDRTPTTGEGNLSEVWTVHLYPAAHLTPITTTGTGTGMIVSYVTDVNGNPSFTLVDSGINYKVGDKMIFQDPFYISTTGNLNVYPTATLEVATKSIPRQITNLFNTGEDSELSYLTTGSLGATPGPDGDGSPV